MKRSLIVTAFVFLFVAMFPPADRIIPRLFSEGPPGINSMGFVFISQIGGPIAIRFPQWVAEMGIVIVLGLIAALVEREYAKPKVNP